MALEQVQTVSKGSAAAVASQTVSFTSTPTKGNKKWTCWGVATRIWIVAVLRPVPRGDTEVGHGFSEHGKPASQAGSRISGRQDLNLRPLGPQPRSQFHPSPVWPR
jgi:hypothetical protein